MIDRPGDSLINFSELSGKVGNRSLNERKNCIVCQTAPATVLPFGQTADNPGPNGLEFAQTPQIVTGWILSVTSGVGAKC